ncbi:TIGR03013 family XrtA/PEP-CTERM system glycosyltransferase [Crenothrix polyspora]|uniref:Undecaprenyl-phosphate galactosephosphotransferase n=1 Tax=Crenothrix polyspora TaxID=360316 RepID=A0A1R4GZK8_9GAMM|nr:TIGR03013 family XrtA/PEP-CTERM system glycosyltransferase [Crenothrix polyspora]SJM89411.1 Undecaprenyl-phosphate galactosephosphotransferase [Crenothrix polyspora]
MIRIFRHYISRAYLWLIIIETGLFFISMYYGSSVRFLFTESWYTQEDITIASVIFSLAMTLSCLGFGLYRRTLSWDDYNLLARTFVSFCSGIFIVVTVYYLIPDILIGRSVLIYAVGLSFLGMMLTRHLFYKFAKLDQLQRRILVIGSGSRANKLLSLNEAFIHKGFKIVGCMSVPNEKSKVDDEYLIQAQHSIIQAAIKYKVDEIVIALDDNRKLMPIKELLHAKLSGFPILDSMGFYEREQGLISLDNIYPSWLVFADGFSQGGLRAFQKRAFDLVSSALLLVVSWPIIVLTALAIYVESGFKGPVLYRQIRVGENGVPFYVLKFRSMKTDAEKNGAQWAQQKDDRVTKVGSFIRKCRIDELPQIYNVFKGEMSFVGPRPERPEFVENFEQKIAYYQERHRVKPGITGWAQLCYPYGASEYDTVQKLQYDLYYVKNYSMFLDFSIMLNTFEVVLWGKGGR